MTWLPQPEAKDERCIFWDIAADGRGEQVTFDPSVGAISAQGNSWQSAAYSLGRVQAGEAQRLLDWVAPNVLPLLNKQLGGAWELGRRTVEVQKGLQKSIGAEIILSQAICRSAAHFDTTDSLLVVVAAPAGETRKLWYAPHESQNTSSRVCPDDSRFLRPEFDPATGSSLEGWSFQELKPGHIVIIPKYAWHSLESSRGSIAVSFTLTSGVKLAEGSMLRVSKLAPTRARSGWSSAGAFCRLWEKCRMQQYGSVR